MSKPSGFRGRAGTRKGIRARLVSLLLTAVLVLGANTMTAFAVTGSTVAADGTYSGTSTSGKEVTVQVTVSNGKVTSVTAPSVKDKYQSLITTYSSSLSGTAATYDAVDAVSAATSGKYGKGVKSAALNAIAGADAADTSGSGSGTGDDSGSGSGDDSGTAGSTDADQTVAVGGEITLSTGDSSYSYYSWTSADTSKVTVTGSGSTATVKGVAVTSEAVVVSCEYGIEGMSYMNSTKKFNITVTEASGSDDDDSEIGKGVGSQTGTKYTGSASIDEESVTLDVYVSDGKIVGIFIAAETGEWLNLLTTMWDTYNGMTASTETVDAVTSSTTLGFRDTLRNAISNALSNMPPVLTSGDGSSYTKGSGSSLTFVSNADFSKFQSVSVDGSTVSDSNYTAKSGSTEVTLSSAYLETLAEGSHTIGIVSTTGTAEGTFTVAAASGGDSGSGESDPVTGVTSMKVTKAWANDSESDRPSSVTVGIYNGSTKEKTLTLTADESWTATATGLDSSVSYTVKEDAVDGYTSTVTKGETTTTDSAGGWTAQSLGSVEAGKTYAFTYTSDGTTYLMGRSGTSVIGSTSGLSNGVPAADIGDDYKWEISKATSGTSYGAWLAKNLGNNYYLAPYKGYSTGYSNAAVLQSSTSYYGNVNLNFDSDGSIWNGYGSLNLYATGATVASSSSSYTVFTPYLYTEGGSSETTVEYTITNTKEESGGGSGGSGSGTGDDEDEDPADPAHVKAISPEDTVAEEYNITLNVTGQSKTTTSTTQTGDSTTSPYDILLVLDNTRSMTSSYGDTTRLAAMISAAKSFVNGLPAADGSKIAMVSFTTGNYNSIVTTNVNWTDLSSGKSTVVSEIGGLNAPDTGYDTYFTQPLERASTLLGNVADDSNKKYVVFFTDGAAAEDLSTIQNLASEVQGKADSTFSIGIVSGSTEENKAKALASSEANYYDVSSAGTMGEGFTSALTTIQSETTVTKVPMTNVSITDTLSDYVELSQADAENKGVTLTASPTDSNVSVKSVAVDGKAVTVTLEGDLTDDTVYTVSIPVKPTEQAQTEANAAETATSKFNSNADTGVTLTYQYGTEDAKTVDYTEKPQIVVAKQVTLTYDANADEDTTVTGMPDPLSETKAVEAEGDTAGKASFTITDSAPTRTGYTFLGWAAEKDATEASYTGEEGKNSIAIDKDTTLYAVWAAEYKVTYSVSGDVPEGYTAPEGQTGLTAGTEVTVAETPDASQYTEKDGTPGTWTFTGWTAPEGVTVEDGKFTMPVADVEMTGTWTFTPATYTVTWMNGDTELEKDTEVAYNAVPSYDGDTPTKDADDTYTYTFKGWGTTADAAETVTLADEKVTKDVTYYAVFEANEIAKYDVTYTVTDSPEGYTAPESKTGLTAGTEVTVAETPDVSQYTEKDGTPGTWTFTGWTAPEGVTVEDGKFTMPAADVEMTGTWTFTPATYTVTWMNGDTELEKDTEVAYNATPSYDSVAPTKTADNDYTYTFKGWGTTADAAETVTLADEKVTKDVTYYAVFEANEIAKYDVTYTVTDSPEGYTAPEGQTGLTAGTEVTVAETPDASQYTEKDGTPGTWTFTGWTAPEGVTVTGGKFTMPAADVELTGTWTFEATPVEKYTVTYTDGVDGEEVFADQVTNDIESGTATPAFNGTPARDGYTFKGWTPEVAETVTENATYTATWEKDQDEPADTEDYTVTTEEKGHTYEIYQIFTGDLTKNSEGKDILVNLVWGENGKGTKGEAVDQETIDALKAVVNETLDKTKLAEIEKNVVLTNNPYKTIKSEDGSAVSAEDLPAGYYLIKDKDGSQTGNDDAYTTYITVVVKDYTIKPKSAIPTVDKSVADAETADYAINESFQFTLTASLPADTDFAAYEKYKVTFTDTMSSGITFEKIDSVTVDGKTIESSKYNASATEGQAGGSWTLTIDDIKTAANGVDITDGCSVVVTYSAHLNENAVAHNAGGTYEAKDANTNSVKLTYSNNPNTGGSGDIGETTTTDYVWVFTYKVKNTKMGEVNGNKSALADAGFKLYTEDGNTEIALAYDESNKVYYPAAEGTEGVEMKSASDGTFNIKGLDAGTYTLKETTTPDGYNTCDDTTVKISATHEEEASGTTAKLTLSEDSNVENEIINKSGKELPSTGGIGTTFFYLAGMILVIGAGIVLITRRRMAY